MAAAPLLRVVACALLTALGTTAALTADTELLVRPTESACASNSDAVPTTFVVTVNPLDKTQVLDDVYLSVFRPNNRGRWLGNIKKFKIQNGLIVGQGKESGHLTTVTTANADSGTLTSNVNDLWQLPDDSKNDLVMRGGAANLISSMHGSPSRTVYTYVSSVTRPTAPIELSLHPVSTTNKAISGEPNKLNLLASDPSRDTVINWALGDIDGNPATTNDTRAEMGASIHSLPVVVVYGNIGADSSEKLTDAVVFATTNDGYLHALDATSGRELWAYIPQELLKNLKLLYTANSSESQRYLLDGSIRVLKYDVDNDGAVEPEDNDRVFLYFSQGRGGDNYYALDVTDKLKPKFLWSLNGASDLSGIVKQSWSTPSMGRVLVGDGSKQNLQKLVLIFGGGYDSDEDRQSKAAGGNARGNAVFMVDAVNGSVLWHQTRAASGSFANMTHAIPSNITALDTNEDGWTDRMYVGDLAGQLWRMDIANGKLGSFESGGETNVLVVGGVIASLGNKVSVRATDNRRFYFAPDVAKIVVRGDSNYYNLAIGTGDLTFPKSNVTTEDRFYSLRDYRLDPMTQAQYNATVPITDSGEQTGLSSLNSQIPLPSSRRSKGWKLPLQTGEKVLAKSVTVNGKVVFTTYLPPQTNNYCTESIGNGRAYTLEIDKGRKHFESLYESFVLNGIPSEVTIVSKSALLRTGLGTQDSATANASDRGSICWSGVTLLKRCVAFGARVKTFWKDSGTN